MVSDLISYELVLFGLLWLCIMLQYVWPSDGPAGDQRTSKPAKPPRPRSRDPKPFPGLICQPHCDGCEQATAVLPLPPPPAPPPVISHTRGCPCQVDPAAQLCPNPDGASYGRVGWGNLHANGHPNRVVFGTTAAVEQVLAACAWQITTAFIECANLSIRQHVAAVGRCVMTLCKGDDGLRQQLALYPTSYNFCVPHASLRQPLPQPAPTNGSGSAKRWQPRTPAMAAGLTDHVWTLRDVLRFRVPPWSQPQAV